MTCVVEVNQFMIDFKQDILLRVYKYHMKRSSARFLKDRDVSSERLNKSRQTRKRINMSTTQEPMTPSPEPADNEDGITATATCFCGAVQLAFVGDTRSRSIFGSLILIYDTSSQLRALA